MYQLCSYSRSLQLLDRQPASKAGRPSCNSIPSLLPPIKSSVHRQSTLSVTRTFPFFQRRPLQLTQHGAVPTKAVNGLYTYLLLHPLDPKTDFQARHQGHEKLKRLSSTSLKAIATDVCEESTRRQRSLTNWVSRSLRESPQYHDKRNLARRKLAWLDLMVFLGVVAGVVHEVEWRKVHGWMEDDGEAGVKAAKCNWAFDYQGLVVDGPESREVFGGSYIQTSGAPTMHPTETPSPSY